MSFALPLGLSLLLTAWGLWQAFILRDPGDVDFSCSTGALWNLAQGSTWMSIAGRPIFGVHSNYTLWLWVPLWKGVESIFGRQEAIWMAPLVLKGVQGILLALSAGILLHPLRRRPWTCNLAGAALIASPPYAAKFLFGFHPEVLGAPVLAWLLVKAGGILAGNRNHPSRPDRYSRLIPLSLATLFLLATKETYSLAIAGLLLWGFVEQSRRDKVNPGNLFNLLRGWGILGKSPLLWSLPILVVGFLCLYWKLGLPYFNSSQPMALAAYQPQSLSHALSLWFRGETLIFILLALFPLLPILMRMPRHFALLPLPWILFYASFPDGGYRELFRHYFFPLTLMGFAAFAFQPGLFRQARWGGALLAASLLAFPLVKPVLQSPLPGSAAADSLLKRRADLRALLSEVPPEASLLGHGPFQYLGASRSRAENFVYRTQPPANFDFVILDTDWREPWMTGLPGISQRWAEERDRDSRTPPLFRVAARGSLELWARPGRGP